MVAALKKHDNDMDIKQRLRLWLRLLRASRIIEAEVRDRLRQRYQTTLPRFDVLAALYKAPDGLRMNELSRQLMVSNGNVTGIVDRLVSDGQITRTTIEGDRRALKVRLTDDGYRRFASMAAEHEGWVAELLSDYNDDEVDTMIDLLDRIQCEEDE
ncbi:MAG: MarR family transcriptional regulator [marine bacterium B5-7]|nr:MAG: MarR family transcriptional regulator [marine bacterium B5-7]